MRLPVAVVATLFASAALAQQPAMRLKPVASPTAAGSPGARSTVATIESAPATGCDPGLPARHGAESIGPKQDDPGTRGIIVEGGLGDDAGAGVRGPGVLAIGPKQDDPGSRGIVVQGGLQGDGVAGVRGPGVLAIGPKQDDPSRPGTAARPGDDEDPHARGGATGDATATRRAPVRGVLAIGPKQDDPRAPAGVAGRPGDDNDPKARCVPRGP